MTYPASSIGWKQGFNKKAISEKSGNRFAFERLFKTALICPISSPTPKYNVEPYIHNTKLYFQHCPEDEGDMTFQREKMRRVSKTTPF